MADVSNRHDQTPTAPLFFGKNGIVEVLGCFTINGHQGKIAQIATTNPFFFPDPFGEIFCFLE